MLMKTNASMLVFALSEAEVEHFQRQLVLLEAALRCSAGNLIQLTQHAGMIEVDSRQSLCTPRSITLSFAVYDPWLLVIVIG